MIPCWVWPVAILAGMLIGGQTSAEGLGAGVGGALVYFALLLWSEFGPIRPSPEILKERESGKAIADAKARKAKADEDAKPADQPPTEHSRLGMLGFGLTLVGGIGVLGTLFAGQHEFPGVEFATFGAMVCVGGYLMIKDDTSGLGR